MELWRGGVVEDSRVETYDNFSGRSGSGSADAQRDRRSWSSPHRGLWIRGTRMYYLIRGMDGYCSVGSVQKAWRTDDAESIGWCPSERERWF